MKLETIACFTGFLLARKDGCWFLAQSRVLSHPYKHTASEVYLFPPAYAFGTAESAFLVSVRRRF